MAQKPFIVNPLAPSAVTTGNEAAGKPALHLFQFKGPGLTWQTTSNANVWVRGDLGVAKAMDALAVLSANAQPGTLIRLRLGDTQAEVDGTADYDSGALPFISPAITNEDGLYHSHIEFPKITKRWFRIDITGHTGAFEAMALIIGAKVQAESFYSKGHGFGTDDLGALEITQWGVADETPGAIWRSLNFRLEWEGETKFENEWRPLFQKIGKRVPVWCCFDPEATTWRQARTYFGYLRDNPFTTIGEIKPGVVAHELSIRSMI